MGAFQPMTIFLRQELDRMQRVIGRVRSTLTDLKLAIDGELQKLSPTVQKTHSYFIIMININTIIRKRLLFCFCIVNNDFVIPKGL